MPRAIATVELRNVPMVLKALDILAVEIRKAPTLEVLAALAKEAAVFQRRWGPITEIANRAGTCWIDAEVRIAEERAKLPKAVGTRGQIAGRKQGSTGRGQGKNLSGGTKLSTPDKTPTDAELGLGKRLAARARKLLEMGEPARKRLVAKLKRDDQPVNPKTVLAALRQENKQEKKHAVATAVFSETGPFDVVVIDPPWQVEKIDRDERPNQDAFDYPTMSVEQIEVLWRSDIEPTLKDDCHVFVWTTQRYLPAAIEMLGKIGLRYVLAMVWHKTGGFQPNDLPQYNCEFAVYARRGKPLFIDTKDFFCCFNGARREHSRKPIEFYDTIRRVTGGSRIDVFSRELHEGFAQYGNELDRFAPKEAAE
jgi:N6-adenosine-specific RNA methylase IME4